MSNDSRLSWCHPSHVQTVSTAGRSGRSVVTLIMRHPDIIMALMDSEEALLPRIVLFGSLAEQTEGIVRDIDLAIESTEFLRISGWLLGLPEAIDVVDTNDLYPHIRDRVETKGRVLYERRD